MPQKTDSYSVEQEEKMSKVNPTFFVSCIIWLVWQTMQNLA